LIDEVEVALDELGATCADTESAAWVWARRKEASSGARLSSGIAEARAAHRHARALIARLGMRPHAGEELIKQASGAAERFDQAVRLFAEVWARGPSTESQAMVAKASDAVEQGRNRTRDYEESARAAVGKLLGPPASL
jgi:hypothetical protein